MILRSLKNKHIIQIDYSWIQWKNQINKQQETILLSTKTEDKSHKIIKNSMGCKWIRREFSPMFNIPHIPWPEKKILTIYFQTVKYVT